MALIAVYFYKEPSLVRALIAMFIARAPSNKQARHALGVSHDIWPPVLVIEPVLAFLI